MALHTKGTLSLRISIYGLAMINDACSKWITGATEKQANTLV